MTKMTENLYSNYIPTVKCSWAVVFKNTSKPDDVFETACGNLFFADQHWPREEGFMFCPYCGNEIE